MWNVITVDEYNFYRLRSILLPLLFEVCTGAQVLWMLSKCIVQNSNTKVSRVQVHSLSEGPTRGLGVRLTSRLMHFCS